MAGQNVGYIRVSTVEQNTARQLDGLALDKVFEDKCSGKDTNRPALQACLEYVREGDTLHVHEISRLARNMGDLNRIVDDLTAKGVAVKFHKEGLEFNASKATDAMMKLLFQVMGAFAEFERNMIRERQAEGIAKAKAEGKYRGGQEKLDDEQVAELRRLAAEGVSKAKLARDFNVTRPTVYRYLKADD